MEHKLYDLGNLQEIAQGDEAFVNEMLVIFVENVTKDIETIRSLQPFEEWKTIAEIAHKMATRFAYLSIDSLRTLSVDIEKSILLYNNFTGIAEKTDKLCDDSILLIERMKKDFEFILFPKYC